MKVAVTVPLTVHAFTTAFEVDVPCVPRVGDIIGSLDEIYEVESVEWVCDPKDRQEIEGEDYPEWGLSDVILRCKKVNTT